MTPQWKLHLKVTRSSRKNSMPLVDVHDDPVDHDGHSQGTDRNSMALVHVADVDGVDNNPMVDDDPMVDSMTPRVGVDHDADGDNHR